MDCRAFEAWLDADRPLSGRAEAERHAESCVDCAAAVAAEDAMTATLRTALAAPAPGFTDQVLSRIAQLEPQEMRLPVDPDLVTPWWVQILREPTALLGLLLGALWTATANVILPMLRGASQELSVVAPGCSLPGFVAGWSLPFLVAATLVLVASLSFGLYRLAAAAFSRLSGLAH